MLLKPWLDFANAALPLARGTWTNEAAAELHEFIQRAPSASLFPAEIFRLYLKPLPKVETLRSDAANSGVPPIARLARVVCGVLDYCVGDSPQLIYQVEPWGRMTVGIDSGRIKVGGPGDVLQPFLRVLEGVEAERLGKCPICARFFFAVRRDQRTCARACATALRVRRHRAKQAQYEYNRKLKSAGLRPGKGRER